MYEGSDLAWKIAMRQSLKFSLNIKVSSNLLLVFFYADDLKINCLRFSGDVWSRMASSGIES